MATFKRGDRAKVIAGSGNERRCIGLCCTVARVCVSGMYEVRMDSPVPHKGEMRLMWLWWPHELAPLTAPSADAWAADAVRKVTKPQPIVPLPDEVLATIRGGA